MGTFKSALTRLVLKSNSFTMTSTTLLQNIGIEKFFDQFDTAKNGKIDLQNFKTMLLQVVPSTSSADAERYFHEIDLDGSGDIDLEEFTQLFSSILQDTDPRTSILQVFHEFDKDGDGYITVTELL